MFEIFDEIIIELFNIAQIMQHLSENIELYERSIDRISIILDSYEW